MTITSTLPTTVQPKEEVNEQPSHANHPANRRKILLGQLLRFGTVGGLNTTIDLLLLNCLLWEFPTQNIQLLLVYNAIAYAFGAINSFLLNKYWTFQDKQRTGRREVVRFTLTTLLGIACNNVLLWLIGSVFHPVIINPTLWANVSKVVAVLVTAFVSYLGMRLWVFVRHPQEDKHMQAFFQGESDALNETTSFEERGLIMPESQPTQVHAEPKYITSHSLSVVLPAYDEEQSIASTVLDVIDVLEHWIKDFEVIIVNDGSTDNTAPIVKALADADNRIRMITHPVNQGYGSTLADGFAAASKEFTFFMDSDGQFDIRDLYDFFSLIDEYDAVIGYRVNRQDSWMRKFNAWGWKLLIGIVLGVHVRDIDCAFKLLHTQFLHEHPLETRGAMINAELLYKLTQTGHTYREVGVHHLPRLGGRATGAKLRVIARAFCELFTYARKWQRGKKISKQAARISKPSARLY